jgi:integrase
MQHGLCGFVHHLSTTRKAKELSMENSIPRNNADKYCQDLKSQAKAVYVRDSEVKGLVLRVKPTGTKSWIFCYTVPCHKKKWRERKKGLGSFKYGRNDVAGLTVSAARREADRLKNEVKHNGADPVEDKRKRAAECIREQAGKVLVKDLFERWAATDLINRKDQGVEARRMISKDVLPFIGDLNIKDVRKGRIAEITDRLLQRGVNRMAKVVLSLTRQMFRFAVTRDLLESDPTALLSKKNIGGANVERDRVLDEDEIKELAKKLPTANMTETATLAVWIVLATCCRIGELLKARWDHVDLERKYWRIPAQNSKNNREHIVYLSSFTVCYFTKLKELTGVGEWCFPASRKSDCLCSKTVTKQITDRQRSNGGLKNRSKQIGALKLSRGVWKPHDLRRTGATLMNALGVLPEVAERCLNHMEENKIKRIYQRYGYEAEMRQAWEKLGERLEILTKVTL